MLLAMTAMWKLDMFRFDDQITSEEVNISDDEEGVSGMKTSQARSLAHSRGLNLVARWPDDGDAAPLCVLRKVTTPLRWENMPLESLEDSVDPKLWFETRCGRDFILPGRGHKSLGRMRAWCPHADERYLVSKSEIGFASEQTRYFIDGFLSGNEPDPPDPELSNPIDPPQPYDDVAAWMRACQRFRATGSWFGRWGTCDVCGCVLLPDSALRRCYEHIGVSAE